MAVLHPDMPSLALVIPHFRQARFLPACLASVFAQDRIPDEVVVVDSSSEETAPALAPFANRVRHLRQYPRGVAAARNAGVAATRSELVAFLDADNEALPACAASQLEAFRTDDVILCHGAMHVIDADGRPWPDAPPWTSEAVRAEHQLGWLLERNRIAADTVCVRRTVFDAAGGFCEARGVREDYDLWLRLADRGRFAYIDAPLVRYRRHETNLSNDEAAMFAWEAGALRRVPDQSIASALDRRFGHGAMRDLVWAEILLRSERVAEAGECLAAGLARWPDEPGFALHAATAHLDAGRVADAEALLQDVVSRHPSEPVAWNNLGVARARQGNRGGAAEAFGRALAIQPVYRDARQNADTLAMSGSAAVEAVPLRVTRRRLRAVPLPLPTS